MTHTYHKQFTLSDGTKVEVWFDVSVPNPQPRLSSLTPQEPPDSDEITIYDWSFHASIMLNDDQIDEAFQLLTDHVNTFTRDEVLIDVEDYRHNL